MRKHFTIYVWQLVQLAVYVFNTFSPLKMVAICCRNV